MKVFFRSLVIVFAAIFFTTNARALYYWDVNSTTGGSGGPTPSGTWSATAAHWSTDDNGTNPASWDNSGNAGAAFSAGGDATGSYTVTVDNSAGQVTAGDLHCDDGAPTLAGGPLNIGGNGQLFSALPGHIFTINCVLQNSPTYTDAFHKYKLGTVILGGSNTLNGSVSIEGGTLAISGNQRIPATSTLILTNGDDRMSDGYVDTPATFNTGGFNQAFGALVLTGPNSLVPRTLDFSNGHGTLSFANSSANSWTTSNNNLNSANPGQIPLTVTNFSTVNAKLRFGTSSNGLTATQLSQIKFADYANLPGVIDNNGFVTPQLPKIQSVTVVGTSVQITWSVVPNRSYEVQYRNNFSSSWQVLGDYSSNGNSIMATDTFSPPARYYRVQVLP